jgi:hypothetical protein
MSVTFWIVFAVGMWVVGVGTLSVCATFVKDADHAQSELFAQARRARFLAPRPRRTHVG